MKTKIQYGGELVIGNNYYDLALNDRKWLLRSLQWDENDIYNRQAVDCQQVVEKVLKELWS